MKNCPPFWVKRVFTEDLVLCRTCLLSGIASLERIRKLAAREPCSERGSRLRLLCGRSANRMPGTRGRTECPSPDGLALPRRGPTTGATTRRASPLLPGGSSLRLRRRTTRQRKRPASRVRKLQARAETENEKKEKRILYTSLTRLSRYVISVWWLRQCPCRCHCHFSGACHLSGTM